MTPATSINNWLATQTDRQDEIGEFARTVEADPDFPDCISNDKRSFDAYSEDVMLKVGTCRVSDKAWKEWSLFS